MPGDDSGYVQFIGLNPSTADEIVNDNRVADSRVVERECDVQIVVPVRHRYLTGHFPVHATHDSLNVSGKRFGYGLELVLKIEPNRRNVPVAHVNEVRSNGDTGIYPYDSELPRDFGRRHVLKSTLHVLEQHG